jgi:co-chaperonin GroES (HSP10)
MGIAERQKIELKELGNKPMINNKVLVKVDFVPEDGTKFGSIILAGGEWDEPGRVARYGTVVKAPKKLIGQWETMFEGAMGWKTQVEIEEGDVVFFGKMEGANAPVIKCGNDIYFVVNYSELILRARNGEIYPLNGNVVVEPVVDNVRVEGLILDFGDFQNKRLGKVLYTGRKNDMYHNSLMVDADVSVGDVVVFEGNWFTEIENDVFAILEKGIGYLQRCWIQGVL